MSLTMDRGVCSECGGELEEGHSWGLCDECSAAQDDETETATAPTKADLFRVRENMVTDPRPGAADPVTTKGD